MMKYAVNNFYFWQYKLIHSICSIIKGDCIAPYFLYTDTDFVNHDYDSNLLRIGTITIINLPPSTPTGLSAGFNEGIFLTWNENNEDDFSHYVLDKDTDDSFQTGQYPSITTTETSYLDTVYENIDFFIGINMNENYLSIDGAGELDGRTYISSNGVNFDNSLSNSGDLNLRAKISTTTTTINIQSNTIPAGFELSQNYPNPFNPVTTLHYDLPVNGLVDITVYDMLGREVKTLINQIQDAGYKSVIWDATNNYGKPVSAGIYLYQIRTGEYISTKKMVLLK